MNTKVGFNTAITSKDKKFSAVEAFDDYFSLNGKKYQVIQSLSKDGKDYFVKTEKTKSNIPLNILKVISYMTGIIPLIMLIGKAITRSQYNFYQQHEKWDAAVKIQAHIKKVQAQQELQNLKGEAAEAKQKDAAATTIQAHLRKFLSQALLETKKSQVAQNKDLFKNAFLDEEPAVAAWLMQKGASLTELEAFTKMIPMTREREGILNWLKTLSEPKAVTPENVDHFALTLGYGYKSANLMIMQQKAEMMSKKLKTATVKVPPFLPVGDFEMTHHLQKHLPQVFTKWQKFLDTTFDPAAKKGFLEAASNEKAAQAGLKITPAGEALLEEIKKEITDHFKAHAYHSPQMKSWINNVKPQFLIVRSTGKEDSDTNSNAGGNASIPYVKPDAQSISLAIGEVIASYFGEKSINQRILCGDQSLFTDHKPFVPVLLQEMVGENLGGQGSKNEDIPRSGVLFTRQSDKAEGVTFIQTGLGNNEGVVSSQVSVDSYFVKEGKIHAVVRHKGTRFVSVQGPDGKISVEPIKNNHVALEKNQALPPNVILDIKRVADEISAAYAKEKGSVKPMDMEYTVKLKEKGSDKPVIYLLQARPLLNTKGEEKVKHSYLDLKALKAEPQKFSSEVLLDGNAYVRTITDAQSIIFADDLPKGAHAYLHADDPSSKKVIIIKKTAPATSHESVVLRPKGVAVVVVSDPQEFASLKKIVQDSSQEKPFLVDTQRGMLVSCSNKNAPLKMIKQGLVSYPIPLEVTVPHSQIMHQYQQLAGKNDAALKTLIANFDQEAETFIKKLQGGKELLLAGYDARELLDIMATKDQEEAKLALASLLKRLKNCLAKTMKETDGAMANMNQPMFQVFEAALRLAQKEIVPALDKYPAQSLERLYSIKFLDAMIHQEMNEDVMGNYSYYQVLATNFVQKKTIDAASQKGASYKGPHALKLIYLHQLSSQAYNEKCHQNWQDLVKVLAKMDSQEAGKLITRLLPLVNQAADLSITDKWLNISFNSAWNKHSTKSAVLKVVAVIADLEQINKTNAQTLAWIQERAGALAIYKQGTANWADPGYAQKQTAKLRKAFTSDLGFAQAGSQAIEKIFKSSSQLGKLALLQYIRDAVNIYDGIIKATKESTHFPNDQAKAVQVAGLLQGYLEMMEATFKLVDAAEQKLMQNSFNVSYKNSGGIATLIPFFDTYVEKLKEGCSYNFGFTKFYESMGFEKLVSELKSGKLDATEQLEARSEFAVDALVVGSKADLNFSVHWPNRLEEYFTTFHQNMEQIIKYCNTKTGLDTSLLSQSAKGLCDQSKIKFNQDISYLNFDNGKLHVGYQIPLRQHSANFVISYDPKNPDKGLDLKMQMFGNDENNRWDWGATFGAIVAYTMTSGFVEETPPQIDYSNPEGVSFTLKLPKNFKGGAKLIDTIHFISKHMTMDKNGEPSKLLDYIQTGESVAGRTYTGLGKLDWDKLNPECYKYTLHINEILIGKLLAKGQNKTAAQVAINSIRGLAHYGLKDYMRTGKHKVSLNERALEVLKKLIPKDGSIRTEVQKLVADPDVQAIPCIADLKAVL